MEKFLMSTDNNRDEYAELLKYEIEMFYITVKELEKKPRKEEEKRKQSVFFEAFLLHTRILIDFFLYKAIEKQLKKKNGNDSIKLINILSNEDAEKLEQTVEYHNLKTLFLEEKDENKLTLRKRLHKCLAHLSAYRKEYLDKKEWDTKRIVLYS